VRGRLRTMLFRIRPLTRSRLRRDSTSPRKRGEASYALPRVRTIKASYWNSFTCHQGSTSVRKAVIDS
jgi:hypothetical protein